MEPILYKYIPMQHSIKIEIDISIHLLDSNVFTSTFYSLMQGDMIPQHVRIIHSSA